MIKHYIEYFYPGLLTCTSSAQETSHRDPHQVAAGKLPERCSHFRFYDREFVGATTDDGERIETMKTGDHNFSPEYYPQATVLNREQMAELYGNEHTSAAQNLRRLGFDRGVRTRVGTTRHFDPKEMVIL